MPGCYGWFPEWNEQSGMHIDFGIPSFVKADSRFSRYKTDYTAIIILSFTHLLTYLKIIEAIIKKK